MTTLQAMVMSAAEAHCLSGLCVAVLQSLRCDALFWKLSLQKQQELEVSPPTLPRQRKRPSHPESAEAGSTSYTFESPTTYYKQMYYECLDVAMTTIKDRFDQRDFRTYIKLEQLLVKAARGEDYTDEFESVTATFGDDFDVSLLRSQLQVFAVMPENKPKPTNFKAIHDIFKSLKPSGIGLIPQVARAVQFVLLMPATNAISERSASALRRIKTFLRTTMGQSRLNNVMVVHINKELTDKIDQDTLLQDFVESNDDRRKYFGLYK